MFTQIISGLRAPFGTFQHRIVHSVDGQGYRRTVKLMFPTLLLLSKARREIVCFAAASNRKVQRITLALAVGNSIVRKHLVPRTTINADIGPLDPAVASSTSKFTRMRIRGDLGSGQSPH